MSPRPRRPKNKALPANLYQNNGGKTYRYRHPVTGKFHGMGTNKAEAIAAAKQLNALLMTPNDLVSNVLGSVTLSQHIEWMQENILPDREYSPATIEMYERNFRKLSTYNDKPLDEITVHDVAALMDQQTPRVANQLRQVATDLFRVGMSRGLCPDNPAEITLKRKEKKARKRLTLDQFKAIRAAAPFWLQNAMDIALLTLQRREDITLMKFDDIRDGALYVVQGKTKKHDTGYLRIAIGPELSTVLKRCRDSTNSPFIVHRRPEKIIKRQGMQHWTQIKPEMVSRQFKLITDKQLANMPAAERPTFHEIRALGIKLYKDQGIDPQQLAGHSTEKMTRNYDAGHDEIRWTEAAASLNLR
ncbi:MAG: phage integrase Arm DNA-binding domain-containing protein [Marinobacterium sp.]|nr:phage integrase Arm DNA-binding domain-containing protein [Marinobacterium sp.]